MAIVASLADRGHRRLQAIQRRLCFVAGRGNGLAEIGGLAVKVDAVFAQWAETAQKLPGLFPDNSKTGGDTHATPKVWETKSDFDAKAADFGKEIGRASCRERV